MQLPDPSLLSQCKLVVDLAYMRQKRREHAEAFPVDGPSPALYLLLDSSPQGPSNWLCQEYYMVSHASVFTVGHAYDDLVRMRLPVADDSDLQFRLEFLEAERALVETLHDLIEHHHMPP
eukprot:15473282-Alexandrium_andersonii.AAC.1